MAKGLLTIGALLPILTVAVASGTGGYTQVPIFRCPVYRVAMETRAFLGARG